MGNSAFEYRSASRTRMRIVCCLLFVLALILPGEGRWGKKNRHNKHRNVGGAPRHQKKDPHFGIGKKHWENDFVYEEPVVQHQPPVVHEVWDSPISYVDNVGMEEIAQEEETENVEEHEVGWIGGEDGHQILPSENQMQVDEPMHVPPVMEHPPVFHEPVHHWPRHQEPLHGWGWNDNHWGDGWGWKDWGNNDWGWKDWDWKEEHFIDEPEENGEEDHENETGGEEENGVVIDEEENENEEKENEVETEGEEGTEVGTGEEENEEKENKDEEKENEVETDNDTKDENQEHEDVKDEEENDEEEEEEQGDENKEDENKDDEIDVDDKDEDKDMKEENGVDKDGIAGDKTDYGNFEDMEYYVYTWKNDEKSDVDNEKTGTEPTIGALRDILQLMERENVQKQEEYTLQTLKSLVETMSMADTFFNGDRTWVCGVVKDKRMLRVLKEIVEKDSVFLDSLDDSEDVVNGFETAAESTVTVEGNVTLETTADDMVVDKTETDVEIGSDGEDITEDITESEDHVNTVGDQDREPEPRPVVFQLTETTSDKSPHLYRARRESEPMVVKRREIKSEIIYKRMFFAFLGQMCGVEIFL